LGEDFVLLKADAHSCSRFGGRSMRIVGDKLGEGLA